MRGSPPRWWSSVSCRRARASRATTWAARNSSAASGDGRNSPETGSRGIVGRELPVIADAELVDPKFGTGAVKVTPAHSFEDFESGKRHHLQFINILNPDGTLNANAGPFQGQDRIAARGPLKAKLEELGLGRGSEPHTMALGRCQRCGTVIEPLMSKQWFVNTKPL